MYLAVYGAFRREQCPGTKEEGDVSLVHERLDVRIDGVTSFERRERTVVNRRQVFVPTTTPTTASSAVDLAGPSDDVVPWSSSSEPLLYSAVAPARCTIRTKTATATV